MLKIEFLLISLREHLEEKLDSRLVNEEQESLFIATQTTQL